MKNELKQSELLYQKQFTIYEEHEDYIRFIDDRLTTMYCHNFLLIKNEHRFLDLLKAELIKRINEKKSFFQCEVYFHVDEHLFDDFMIKPEITIYDFMINRTEKYKDLKGNLDCVIKKAITKDILNDGIKIDILSNEGVMGEFATKRILRKAEVYEEENSLVGFYVCYHKDSPIGSCELLKNQVAKIEDFDIYEPYQRKGFGTSVIKHLLKEANELGIEYAYVITDSCDTAKDMYQKCGFTKIMQKTILFFNLVNE